MPTSPPNFYEVLQLPPNASLDEIKKRYRQLAKQHHPDLNANNPVAARKFAEVSEAYRTLSNATSRASYDAELVLKERRAEARASRDSAPFTPPRPSPFAPSAGAGRARPASYPPNPSGASVNAAAEVARLIAEAQAAFVRGKFIEARNLCEQAIQRDRRSARAYEILGDVYRLQGRGDDAIHMYTMVLQLDPRNLTVQHRLERLSRSARPNGPTAQATFFDNREHQGARGFPNTPSSSASGRATRDTTSVADRRPIGVLLAGVFGYGLTFLLILFAAITEHQPFGNNFWLSPVASWSVSLVMVMTLAGGTLGATMAITGAIRRIEDELILTGGGRRLPLGLLLIVVSFLSFYAAALLHLVVSLLQEALTPSMIRVFGAVVLVVIALAAVYAPGRPAVLIFGGNVVFLSLLVGWALGDFFRGDS